MCRGVLSQLCRPANGCCHHRTTIVSSFCPPRSMSYASCMSYKSYSNRPCHREVAFNRTDRTYKTYNLTHTARGADAGQAFRIALGHAGDFSAGPPACQHPTEHRCRMWRTHALLHAAVISRLIGTAATLTHVDAIWLARAANGLTWLVLLVPFALTQMWPFVTVLATPVRTNRDG